MTNTAHAPILARRLLLSGCGSDSPHTEGTGPGRMVRRIEVAIEPADVRFDRTYVTQENMNALLTLLRSMQSDIAPDREPDVDNGQSLYIATVTFANGQQSVYYLLGHTYMRLGDAPWCIITGEQSMAFNTFLREHPSDDVPPETTAAPTETTAPTE